MKYSKKLVPHLFGALMIFNLVVFHHTSKAADVEFMGVIKSESYFQIDATTHVLDRLRFEAFVSLSESGQLNGASVTIPGDSTIPLDEGDGIFEIESIFNSRTLMDQVFANGIYTLSYDGVNDGTESVMLEITGNSYPNTPRFTNYEATQQIDPESDFTLTWQPFSSPGPNDFLIVEVEEISPSGGDDSLVFETDFLDPTTMSILVPSTSFQSGNDYRAILTFVHATDFEEVPNTAIGGYLASTEITMRLAGSGDMDPPYLVNSLPFLDQGDVPVRSAIRFDFNEAMDTSINPGDSIIWSNLDPANFTYRWGVGDSNLFCIYNLSLPTATTIEWTLNPLSGSQLLRDVALNILFPDTTGSFTTADTDPGPVPDVIEFSVAKGQKFNQTDSITPPVIMDWFGSIFTEFAGLNGLISLQVTPPGRDPILIPNLSFEEEIYEELTFSSQEVLNQIFPDGVYEIQMDTAHDGIQTATLQVSSSTSPTTPRVANFDPAQEIDPDSPFTLQWDAFEGGTTDDIVFIYIADDNGDDVFSSPDLNEVGRLSGTAMMVEIPTNAFQLGSTYYAELEFIRISDENDTSYPGAIGRAGFAKLLEFEINTIFGPPELSISVTDNSVNLTITGQPDTTYRIQVKDNLTLDTWRPFATVITPPDSSIAFFTDVDVLLGDNQRYYRVIEDSAP